MTDPRTREVNVIGSVPLESEEAVFRALAGGLGERLRRMPDGETEPLRRDWIVCQVPVLQAVPQFEAVVPADVHSYAVPAAVRLRPGARGADVAFGPLGYADWAAASYAVFARLKRTGVIATDCRFQVCVPTPMAVVNRLVVPDDAAAVEPAYHARMRAELAAIPDAIPHGDLAVQLDVAYEFGVWEGIFPTFVEGPRNTLLDRLADIGGAVPEAAELGFHLCYGDLDHQHFVKPHDMAHLVAVANGLAGRLARRVDWISVPVPLARDDDGYFAPLADLAIAPATKLFLGLIHLSDGANRRIATAARHASEFGIATECGWGRRPPETIVELIALHAAI